MRACMVPNQSDVRRPSVSSQGLTSFLEPCSASDCLRLTIFLKVNLIVISKWMLCKKANVDPSKFCTHCSRFRSAGNENWNHDCPVGTFIDDCWEEVEDGKIWNSNHYDSKRECTLQVKSFQVPSAQILSLIARVKERRTLVAAVR